MARDDGGAAFPRQTDATVRGMEGTQAAENGMSLRDYFAAQALVGFLSDRANLTALLRPVREEESHEAKIATVLYKMADAMLAERAK